MEEFCLNGRKLTRYWNCDPIDKCHTARCVKGQCIHENISSPENDICFDYACDPETGNFSATPRCVDGLYCTTDDCWNYGSFYECHYDQVDCGEYINMAGYDCFLPACREDAETFRCVRKLLPNAYVDICGNCIKDWNYDESEAEEETFFVCTNAPPEPLTYETLAAASIAMIILGAILLGGAITTSGVIATKELVKRARAARNMAAQNNPLFEGVETEMANPAFSGKM